MESALVATINSQENSNGTNTYSCSVCISPIIITCIYCSYHVHAGGQGPIVVIANSFLYGD